MIFIDTGAFIAQSIARDQHRQEALEGWRQIQLSTSRCYTSNFVLDETFTYLARHASYELAAHRARSLFSSDVLHILRPDGDDEVRALGYFEKFADQRVSFTDCLSFALMERQRIRRAFSFDRHFALAGFELWPGGWSSVHEPRTEYDAGDEPVPSTSE